MAGDVVYGMGDIENEINCITRGSVGVKMVVSASGFGGVWCVGRGRLKCAMDVNHVHSKLMQPEQIRMTVVPNPLPDTLSLTHTHTHTHGITQCALLNHF